MNFQGLGASVTHIWLSLLDSALVTRVVYDSQIPLMLMPLLFCSSVNQPEGYCSCTPSGHLGGPQGCQGPCCSGKRLEECCASANLAELWLLYQPLLFTVFNSEALCSCQNVFVVSLNVLFTFELERFWCRASLKTGVRRCPMCESSCPAVYAFPCTFFCIHVLFRIKAVKLLYCAFSFLQDRVCT